MRRILAASLVLFVGAAGVARPAQAQSLGASITVGSNGPGVSLSARIGSKLNLRLAGNYFNYTYEGNQTISDTDVGFDTDAQIMLAGALADWHPFGGEFRLSAGAFYNGMEGDGAIRLLEPYTVETRTYSPEEVGELAMKINFDSKIAPYASLGLGNALTSRFSFNVELGALYMGSPAVDLTATGMLKPTESEAAQIEENLSWAKVYPVLSIGISSRIF